MIIYKATNKTTKKEYVGLTKNELSNRKADHKRKAKSGKSTMAFHDAIRKYGFENFEWEIIDTATTLEELNEKEIYWIKKLNTLIPNGYNIEKGGQVKEFSEETLKKMREADRSYAKTKFYSWDEKGLIKEYESKKELVKELGIRKGTLIDNNRGYFKNGILYTRAKVLTEKQKNRLKKILHFSKEGVLLGSYFSAMEMEKKTKEKYWNTTIGEVLKGKKNCFEDLTTVIWSDKILELNLNYEKKCYQEKKVIKISLDDIKLEVYKTIKDAREKNNITNYSGISEVCRGKRKTCGGFKWEFFEK